MQMHHEDMADQIPENTLYTGDSFFHALIHAPCRYA